MQRNTLVSAKTDTDKLFTVSWAFTTLASSFTGPGIDTGASMLWDI